MVSITFNLNEEANIKVKYYMAMNAINSKEKAINDIIIRAITTPEELKVNLISLPSLNNQEEEPK